MLDRDYRNTHFESMLPMMIGYKPLSVNILAELRSWGLPRYGTLHPSRFPEVEFVIRDT